MPLAYNLLSNMKETVLLFKLWETTERLSYCTAPSLGTGSYEGWKDFQLSDQDQEH